MIIRILIFIFLGIIPLASFAQTEFVPGLVALNEGDTLRGFIKTQSGRINPRTVEFRNSLASESQFYFPHNIRWFRYTGGDWYFSYAGAMEASSLNSIDLDYDSTMHTINDTLFIQAIIISRASLFYARDKNDRIHLFFSKAGSAITELAYKKYYIDELVVATYENNITKRTIMENEMYKGQLMHAFSDCRYLSTGIPTRVLNYSRIDLLKLFEEYNRCRGVKVIYKAELDKGKLEVSIKGGANYTSVDLFSSLTKKWNNVEFDPTIGWQAGFGFNWLLPELQNKFSADADVLLRYYYMEGHDASTDEGLDYTMSALYMKIILMGQYQMPKGKVRPLFGLGMSNSFLLGNKLEQLNEDAAEIFDAYRKYEQGLVLSVGVRWKDLLTEVRFEHSNGWSDYSDLSTKFSSWYLQIGYVF